MRRRKSRALPQMPRQKQREKRTARALPLNPQARRKPRHAESTMHEDQGRDSPLLTEYLRHLSLERGLSPNTCKAYAGDVRAFIKHLGGTDPLKATPEALTDYLGKLRSAKKLKPSSAFRAMEALRSFYRFQVSEDRL